MQTSLQNILKVFFNIFLLCISVILLFLNNFKIQANSLVLIITLLNNQYYFHIYQLKKGLCKISVEIKIDQLKQINFLVTPLRIEIFRFKKWFIFIIYYFGITLNKNIIYSLLCNGNNFIRNNNIKGKNLGNLVTF